MLTQVFRFECYDCLTLFLLAASCASRGRVAGESPTACFLVGLFSALVWPLARELLFHGSCLAVFASLSHQVAVLGGACVGTLYSLTLRYFEPLVVWTEIVALSLACTFGVLCALPRTSVSGALFVAFFLTALPHMCCDVLLGDIARFLSESSRLIRAFIGAIVATGVVLLVPPYIPHIPEIPEIPVDALALLAGLIVACGMQLRKPR